VINKNQTEGTAEQFLRRAGYAYIRDRRTGKDSFARRLGGGFYPRLHMYVIERGEQIIFDLHLDQKQASYAGSRMHNAEHGGEVVEEEIGRLNGLASRIANRVSHVNDEPSDDGLNKIGHGDLASEKIEPKKISWWRRIFI